MEQHNVMGRVKVFAGEMGPTVQIINKKRVAVYQQLGNEQVPCSDFADTMSRQGRILCVQRYWHFGPHSRVVLFGRYQTQAYDQLKKYINEWYIVEGKTKLPTAHIEKALSYTIVRSKTLVDPLIIRDLVLQVYREYVISTGGCRGKVM